MKELYVPTLHSFAMENMFTGSDGLFRFRIVPEVKKVGKEVDYANSCIHAQYWHGLQCFEKSQIEDEKTFPMSEQGREALLCWLQAHN